MERIHTHNPVFDSNAFGPTNKCTGAPCPLGFRTYTAQDVCAAVTAKAYYYEKAVGLFFCMSEYKV